MKRKITTFVLIVMFSSPIFAQQSNMDYTPLKPFVPSGILYEHNPSHIFHNPSHLNHPMHFFGDTDSVWPTTTQMLLTPQLPIIIRCILM